MNSSQLQQVPYDSPQPPKYEQTESSQHVVSQQPPYAPHPYDMYHSGYNQQPQQQPQQQQQHHLTVNVINQQPSSQEMRTWSTTICGCFEDMSSCCCITWFCPCYTCCNLSPRLGESCCAPVCLSAMGHSVPMVYRTKVRAAHGISGGAIDDCTNVLCCAPCVMCQMKREIDYIERATGKPAFR